MPSAEMRVCLRALADATGPLTVFELVSRTGLAPAAAERAAAQLARDHLAAARRRDTDGRPVVSITTAGRAALT